MEDERLHVEPFSFQFTPTADDYVRKARHRLLKNRVFWSLLVGFLITGVGLTLLTGFLNWIWVAGVIVASVVLSGAYVYFVRPLFTVRLFRKHERFRAETTWTVDDGNIMIVTKYGEARTTWGNFVEVEETKTHYYLRLTGYPLVSHMIPKRAFESAEQESMFRDLMAQRGLGLK